MEFHVESILVSVTGLFRSSLLKTLFTCIVFIAVAILIPD